MKKRNYKIYKYSEISETYEFFLGINHFDVISTSSTFKDFPEHSEFVFTLKRQFSSVVEEKGALIMTVNEGEEQLYFFYITEREYNRTVEGNAVILTGVSFGYFEENKLINSNLDYPGTYEELPSGFATYRRTLSLKNHLDYLYFNSFLQPKTLTFGRVSDTIDERRKFKGLNDIETVYNSSITKNISIEQTNFNEAKQKIFETFDVYLVQKEYFLDGKINIVNQVREERDVVLIRTNTSILEEIQTITLANNFVFGYGEANNDISVSNLNDYDFTSIETSLDASFVSGENEEYLRNTTNTELRKSVPLKNSSLIKIKVNPDLIFREFFVGDVINLKQKKYILTQIQETNDIGGLKFDVEIKEVTNGNDFSGSVYN